MLFVNLFAGRRTEPTTANLGVVESFFTALVKNRIRKQLQLTWPMIFISHNHPQVAGKQGNGRFCRVAAGAQPDAGFVEVFHNCQGRFGREALHLFQRTRQRGRIWKL